MRLEPAELDKSKYTRDAIDSGGALRFAPFLTCSFGSVT